MRKLLLFLPFFAILSLQAQTEGECGASSAHKKMLSENSAYAAKMAAFDARYQTGISPVVPPNTTDRIIPVVVHVMHLGEPLGTGSNISDEDIKAKIQAINERYRKIPGTYGDGDGVDVNIEFALAVRDPDGNCTNGITRTDMSGEANYAANGVLLSYAGMSDIELKAFDYWDSNDYYNIWLVSEIDNGVGGTTGFAYFAAAHGEDYDGAIILAGAFRNPESSAAVHELGHAFNLYHTFEGDGDGSNCPDETDGCGYGEGDCCSDTPAHKRTIVGDCDGTGTNECGTDINDLSFRNNYMDYAGVCRNMFTPLQKVRVLDAVDNERASLLGINGNMSLVPVAMPEADFTIETGTLVCQNENLPIKILDKSSCMPNNFLEESDWGEDISFLWTVSNGTDEYTYTSQNPQFTLSVPGTYSVTLTVTNAFGSDTKTLENALLVTNSNTAATCMPGSEENGYFTYTVYRVAMGDIDNSTSSVLSGLYEDFRCSQNTVVVPGETYPLLISARANNDYDELFRVYIDYDNNGAFENDELIFDGFTPAGSMATHTTTITIPSNAVQDNLLTMRVIGEPIEITSDEVACNEDFFVADVEDYGVYITSTLSASDTAYKAFTLSPNPAETSFTLSGNSLIERISLYNMLGQLVLETTASESSVAVEVASLAAGTYLVQVTSQGKTNNLKLIKE